jgi:hypothetical protein
MSFDEVKSTVEAIGRESGFNAVVHIDDAGKLQVSHKGEPYLGEGLDTAWEEFSHRVTEECKRLGYSIRDRPFVRTDSDTGKYSLSFHLSPERLMENEPGQPKKG